MALKAGYKGIKEVGPGLDLDTTTGLLSLGGESGLSLDNLSDVDVADPAAGDLLIYNSTSEAWENEAMDTTPTSASNKPVTSGGVYTAVKELKDVIGLDETNLITSLEQGAYNANGTNNHSSNRASAPIIWLKKGNYKVEHSTSASGKTTQFLYSTWTNNKTDGTNSRISSSAYATTNEFTLSNDNYVSLSFKYSDDSDITLSDLSASLQSMIVMSDKVDTTVIGNVEDGANASQAYAVGSHFTRNGKFCTVISAIAEGATLTLNTNYVEGAVGDYVDITYKTTSSVSVPANGNTSAIDIPTISGYIPFNVTVALAGAGRLNSGVHFTYDTSGDTQNVLSNFVLTNSDSSNHSWNVRLNVHYIKSTAKIVQNLS